MSATQATHPTQLVSRPSHRFGLLASLYVSQAIPLGFFIEAVPAIGRDMGLSLRAIGMIQVLALPYMIKFLWAPVVDAVGSPRLGHYRSWLFPLQSVAVAAVLLMAVTDPGTSSVRLIGLAAIFLLVAATQDIATDALAVRLLAVSERGTGNGIQVGGYYLGQVLGGGLMLILLERFGWGISLGTMAAAMSVPLLLLIGFREPAAAPPSGEVDFGALRRFFTHSGSWSWVLVLLLYRMGDAMAITMAKPMLVDFGWSLSQIGVLIGVGTSMAALSGALSAGHLIGTLGRRPALIGFEVLHALALLGTGAAVASGRTAGPGASVALVVALVVVSFAGGMSSTALYTWMMDRSNVKTPGTDFTMQQALAAMGPLIAAGLSGFSANSLGYPAHFLLCAGLSLVVAVGILLSGLGRT